jgi:DNA-binding NarL/FixJ family response regulator
VRLILAEDSMVFREGLARLLSVLGHEVVAAVPHAGTVLTLVGRHRPDAVISDIRMPPTHTDEGLRLATEVRRRHPSVAVLVLSEYAEPAFAGRLLDGERRAGYLLKQSVQNLDVLDDTLARLHAGEIVVDPILIGELMRGAAPGNGLDQLTGREREVLALVAEGLSDQGIGARLHLSVSTVCTHTKAIFRKLSIADGADTNRRVSAALRFLDNGATV